MHIKGGHLMKKELIERGTVERKIGNQQFWQCFWSRPLGGVFYPYQWISRLRIRGAFGREGGRIAGKKN